MAMEGTHIRFARDLLEPLGVVDAAAYFSGAVYPDSRYRTGIPREETHGQTCPHNPFAPGLTDFERGWSTHILYDRSSSALHEEILGAELPEEWMGDAWKWAVHTARKGVEELRTCQVLGDDIRVLQELSYVCGPRGEDEQVMQQYHERLREAYLHPYSIAHAAETLQMWGTDGERVARFTEVANWILERPNLTSRIQGMYDTVLQNVCPFNR